MKKPLISIIMPIYNAMPYLEQAIQSIYAQTLTDWELIAVDDSSTDGSWNYLQQIDDPRVRITRNDRNMKHSYTCNHGVELARGKYVAKMDADDMMLPVRLEKQVYMLENNPEMDVVGCGLFKVRYDMSIINVRRPPSHHDDITRLVSSALSFVHGPNFLITDGAMAGRSKWFQRWKYDICVRYSQDFDLICRSQKESVLGNVTDPLYVYRTCSGETSSWIVQTRAVYYKARSLLKYGFHKNAAMRSFLGLIALVPRPLAYAMVHLIAHNERWGAKIPVIKVAPEDIKTLHNGLSEIAKAQVPLKKIP